MVHGSVPLTFVASLGILYGVLSHGGPIVPSCQCLLCEQSSYGVVTAYTGVSLRICKSISGVMRNGMRSGVGTLVKLSTDDGVS
ncbi:hypothetical protein COP2_002675 [Malus domestica]